MKPLNEYETVEDILSDEIFIEIFDQENEIYKAKLLLSCQDRAAELGCKSKFDEMVKAYRKVERQILRQTQQKRNAPASLDNWTNFEGPYGNMYCGSWIAREDGIYAQNMGTVDQVACYHPILPIKRFKNLETKEEQIKIAFKRNRHWEEITVPKTLITSANKIVSLSAYGIAVTSENAKLLVRYLSDVENQNNNYIDVQHSTSKLGWNKKEFIPYDTDIMFDGDHRFGQIFESITEQGDRDCWYTYVRKLRQKNRIESKFMLAASFSSILVPLLGGLPYIVDLYGETEGGKTVTLMLACSVWANPDESTYIGDFKSTEVALEARADMLNNLPMILDDTSKTSGRIRDNFEGFVYDLCSGKGKSRSNKDLGMNRENRWKCAILTNGERALSSYVQQGGAMNRILGVECGANVYDDPQETATFLKQNYGFSGRDFVQVIKEMGIDKIKAIQQEIQVQIKDDEKMQKQSISLSVVLTADRIVTDHLFRDSVYITLEEAKKLLVDREEISDNERCYRFVIDKVAMNPARFDSDTKIEKWGVIENGYAIIRSPAFDALCQEGGYSKQSFLSWANKKKLIQPQGGKNTRVKKIGGDSRRCVFLKLNRDMDEDGFEPMEQFEMDQMAHIFAKK